MLILAIWNAAGLDGPRAERVVYIRRSEAVPRYGWADHAQEPGREWLVVHERDCHPDFRGHQAMALVVFGSDGPSDFRASLF